MYMKETSFGLGYMDQVVCTMDSYASVLPHGIPQFLSGVILHEFGVTGTRIRGESIESLNSSLLADLKSHVLSPYLITPAQNIKIDSMESREPVMLKVTHKRVHLFVCTPIPRRCLNRSSVSSNCISSDGVRATQV
ncbi:hypothetical protein O6P43_013412 [Quillaja saponaria]|uniref:Uncharacterized protein n=1 Tax=Quillaja saponaria TaxID=32244 RepID=A0AAD7M3R6_QUISA|nr:hypothetical protein O6P43_013412 [Quillaja saponaria]KAJ7969442.1 hypothetical protein O6P43_013412 [Quillaja saponaria]